MPDTVRGVAVRGSDATAQRWSQAIDVARGRRMARAADRTGQTADAEHRHEPPADGECPEEPIIAGLERP